MLEIGNDNKFSNIVVFGVNYSFNYFWRVFDFLFFVSGIKKYPIKSLIFMLLLKKVLSDFVSASLASYM